MGLFQNLLGKGKNRCGVCGRSTDSSMDATQIDLFGFGPDDFSLSGMRGHCHQCNIDLCDRHLEIRKQEFGKLIIRCGRCHMAVN